MKFINFYKKFSSKSFKEIPGPKRLPLIGNYWRYLPIIGQYNIEKLYENGLYNLKHYGPIVREEINDNHNILHLFDPIDMESMFQQQQKNPYRRSHRALIKYRMERPNQYQSGGIFPENGVEWKRLRDLFKHYFLNPKNIHVYDKQLNEIVIDLINVIKCKRNNFNFNLDEDFQRYLFRWSSESICSIMLDTRIGCLDMNNIDGSNMIIGCHKTLLSIMRTELYNGWEENGNKDYQCLVEGQDLMAKVVIKFLDKKMNEFNIKNFTINNNELTILEQMIQDPNISYKDLFGIVMDFVFAGIDTTSITAGFTLYFLAKNPSLQQRLFDEIKNALGNDEYFQAKHFENTPLLKACIKETLRLRPISIGVGRLSTNDMIISNYHIPKNTMIITQNQVACRLAKYYNNANNYDPDRWLRSNNNNNQNNKLIHRYLYIPFGHGTRMCLGRRIAELELYILISNIIFRFQLHYNENYNIEQRTCLINLPNRPIKLKFIDRK